MRQYFQVIPIQVNQAGEQIRINTNTKAEHEVVRGILFYIGKDKASIDSLIELKINGAEIFPRNFPVEIFCIDFNFVDQSMREREYKFNEKARASLIEGIYTDGGNASAYPYTMHIVLRTSGE